MKIRQISQLTASDMMVAIIGWDVRYAFDRLTEALMGVEEYSKRGRVDSCFEVQRVILGYRVEG